MQNQWAKPDAEIGDAFDQLVYQSRLIGADTSLVVWGGGNTSIKSNVEDFRGRPTEAMIIKGSGSDLKTIEKKHFPSLKMEDVLPLYTLEEMTDDDMVAYLGQCMLNPKDPRPSIETLLHAFLPFHSVVHSHADAIVALTNTRDAETLLQEVYGDTVSIVEYIRPGFKLSKLVGKTVESNPSSGGVVLMNHGLFTWGDTSHEAYDRHIDLVAKADYFAQERRKAKTVFTPSGKTKFSSDDRKKIAASLAPVIRGAVSELQDVVLRYDDNSDILEFVDSSQGNSLSQIGPATPDHTLQTKIKPLWLDLSNPQDFLSSSTQIKESIKAYALEYSQWYEKHTDHVHPMLDPYPRLILVPGLGMWSTGKDARAALIAGDIYHHTIQVIKSAEGMSTYVSLTDQDAYDVEYWPMELYKLTIAPPERSFSRKVALVTGAANGIGKVIAQRLAAEGAHVVVTDLNSNSATALAEEINGLHGLNRALPLPMDVTNHAQILEAFHQIRLFYGGLDIVISNAGIAPAGIADELPISDWQNALDVNTTGHFLVSQEAVRLMKQQEKGGSIVFIGTKNVPSPGGGFGAYSVSKAAQVQLARVLAIENGEFGIRCNVVNPDAIFQGSNLWSTEMREQRAQAHGISVDGLEEFYRQRNLLKKYVTSDDVANTVLFLASEQSSKTTGAMIPIDGGLRDAFPR